jgi:nicotinate phosphoribosyltransferase
MQACVLRYFASTHVTYAYTNRTPHFKFSRKAVRWLQAQIDRLEHIGLTSEEGAWLAKTCTYLPDTHLRYLKGFKFKPKEHIRLSFKAVHDTGGDDDIGDIDLHTEGLWVETILYEIPLLALISETYFRFMDTDWKYDGQIENARRKGEELLKGGCIFSEFGTRRRRDYHTQDLVLKGLIQAAEESKSKDWPGKLSGTSNVHFAMRYDLQPVGTVAHEWFMGVAAVTDDYENASEDALRYWVATFGEGVLGIALTDTFGTESFLQAFKNPIPAYTGADQGAAITAPSAGTTSTDSATDRLAETKSPIHAPIENGEKRDAQKTYAQVFTGVRQDSGDPEAFIKLMRTFYDAERITDRKNIVFSDSLNVDLCFKYKAASEAQGFAPTFGVGTFLTNDYHHASNPAKKSLPLNIVIKLSSADGNPAIKISDNLGKNTGDKDKVEEVKRRLGYTEKAWAGGDEASRWGKEENGK